jgi:hypothetical protein
VNIEVTKALIPSDFKDRTAFSILIDRFIGKVSTSTPERTPKEKEKEEEEEKEEEVTQIVERKDVSIIIF